jgi:hypothetical protein
MLDSTPMEHRGSPQNIAYGVLPLASEEARFVTGTELVVDGRYTTVRAVTPRSCLRAPTTGPAPAPLLITRAATAAHRTGAP